MRLIVQTSAYYWYRYWSCLRLIIWFLGTGKWFFVLENHFLVPWKQTIRNFEMPTCVDICNAMAEVGAICSIRWINWNKIHTTKNKTQNSNKTDLNLRLGRRLTRVNLSRKHCWKITSKWCHHCRNTEQDHTKWPIVEREN